MTKTAVRKADAADVPALAGALARAFDDDPVMAWLFPETRVLVVGEAAHAPLEDLAWDLGAALCLFPPGPEDRLPDIVAALMGLRFALAAAHAARERET